MTLLWKYFDKERTRYGLLLVAIGLPLIFLCVQITMDVISLIGLNKINSNGDWSEHQKIEGLLVFLVFPFGFGFSVADNIVNGINKRFPITSGEPRR